MASLLPRTSSMLPRSSSSSSSIIPTTTTCRRRLLSTTPSARRQQIPPESPLFINVPNPPQDQSIEAKRDLKPVKGFLPRPRQIFAKKGSEAKPTKAYLDLASPAPSAFKKLHLSPKTEKDAWKRRMAANRRENIRAGVTGLWDRKQRSDAIRQARSAAKAAEHRIAAMAPEREDERLTRSTINAQTLDTTVRRDPGRFERALASQARTGEIEVLRSAARRDAIQTLYMSARSFIVSEAALEAAIEKEFAPDRFSRYGTNTDLTIASNIWDVSDVPPSVASMMRDLNRSTPDLLKGYTGDDVRTTSRQKVVAEELTGGKMD